jgi:hypothetical protein
MYQDEKTNLWISNNGCWKNLDSNEKRNGTDWSDRLWQRNPERFNGLCQKHFGNTYQTFYEDRPPEKIEAFLKEYNEVSKLILLEIIQEENRSNGYPYWVFKYYWEK